MREVGHIVGQVLFVLTIVLLISIANIKTQSYQDRRLEALYAAAILRGFCWKIMIEQKIIIYTLVVANIIMMFQSCGDE